MKKLFYTVLAAVAMASCSDSAEEVGNPQIQQLNKEYAASFTKMFGSKIDPQNNWGFDAMEAITVGESESRTANTNSNMWASEGWDIPAAITEEEAKAVFNYFDNPANYDKATEVNYTDFFVQHVWRGNNIYTANNGGQLNASDKMDWLFCGGVREVNPWYSEPVDHINNFNSSWGSIMLMVNTTSSGFGYNNSEDSKLHQEYILLEVPYTENGVQKSGYYVGFDYYANGQNPNQQVDRDSIYTDWIVKIVPGKLKAPEGSIRVMCEDLGNMDDFDFNDVVFDLWFTNEWWPETGLFANVILQAAGGTMPLYIGEPSLGNEVHSLFKVPVSTMVNTGAGATREPVKLKVKISGTPEYNKVDPASLPIYVQNKQGLVYSLFTETGKAPQKIAAPVTTKWSKERINILETYPTFKNYVKDHEIKWFEQTNTPEIWN